jgi:hypothetical protein
MFLPYLAGVTIPTDPNEMGWKRYRSDDRFYGNKKFKKVVILPLFSNML